MTKRLPLNKAIYAELARIGKATANPHRLELLNLLAQAPRTVDSLAQATGLSMANTSQHLQVLHRAGMLERDKRGLHVEYRIADVQVASFLAALGALAQARLSEVKQVMAEYHRDRGQMERVDQDALLARVKRGEVSLIDVRPVEEFEAGHATGAVCMPLGQLEDRIDELPADREVVAYCRGPFCVFAVEAVALLRARGFEASRLEHGIATMRDRGVRITEGS